MYLAFETLLSNLNERHLAPARNASALPDAGGRTIENTVNRWTAGQHLLRRAQSSHRSPLLPPFTALADPATVSSVSARPTRVIGCQLLPSIYRGIPENQVAFRSQLYLQTLHQMSKASQFEKTFLPHLEAAYNLARWIVGDEEQAEAVVQETYTRAWKNFSTYHGDNPRVWLLTIVRNIASSRSGKRISKEKSFLPDEQTPDFTEQGPPSHLDDHVRRFWQALNSLTGELREVLVLSHLEGWSYQAIATALGVSLETVASRLSRARHLLREELRPAPDRDVENEL
jgi:RNA polymerase sigma-70 factor, ECF subfamily